MEGHDGAPEGAVPATDRLERAGALRASWSLLRRNPDFRRLFLASVISLGGDWFLFVAINGFLLEATGDAVTVGLAILSQELAFFLASPYAGVLADRVDRRRLMIATDLVRVVLCLAFLLVTPTTIWLAFPLLALLSVFSAPFDPASSAAIPNLVEPEDLPTANALGGSLWGTMLAVGAALGGIVATVFGKDVAFVVDSGSFALSALLLWRIHRPFSEAREEHHEHPGTIEATRETFRYAGTDHRVMAMLLVKGGFGAAAGVLALIPVFATKLYGAGALGFGFLMACRGVGALIGPFIGHRLSGQGHRRIYPTIALALTTFGFGYVLFGFAPSILIAAAAILLAHLGGGAQWVLSSYSLQVLVPDRIRGRIFAFDFALVTLTLAISSLGSSLLADTIGPRQAAWILGGIAIAWAGVWWIGTRKVRRQPPFEVASGEGDGGPAEPDAVAIADR
jgi:predicted MFS family arabinose efflux permease